MSLLCGLFYVIEPVSFSIIKISSESRALLSCYDLEKNRNNKKNKRVHIDLIDSNNFTHRKYEA